MAVKSVGEETLALHLRAEKIPHEREYRFAPDRRWRFDFALPERKLAVEIDGGVWTAGRHTRGSGAIGDMQKFNRAAAMGWWVLRYTPDMVQSGQAIREIKAMLAETHVV